MADKKTETKLRDRALEAYTRQKPAMDKLSSDRIKANNYFYGIKRGDEIEGRSGVISRDLFEVILWQLTDLVRIFLSGQNVVEATPNGADDVEKAKLMEEKLNFDFKKLNNGFKILLQFFLDALLHKVGTVKYFWKREYKYKHHKYYGITLSELNFLKKQTISGLDNPRESVPLHIFDKEELVNEGGIAMDGSMIEPTYDIKCRERIRMSYPVAVNVPPEEINFNLDMKDRDDPDGVIIHRIKIHKRKLKDYGFTEDDILEEIAAFESGFTEKESRFADLGGLNFVTDDKESEFVYLNECYLYDFDEEGNPIPKIVPIIGRKTGKIQDNEYGVPNFAFITPFIIAHRMVGLSTYDTTYDIQDIQTAFLRMILDSGYYQNNGINVINQYRIDMTDYLEGARPGMNLTMLYDSDPNSCIANVQTPPLPAQLVSVYTKIMPEIKAGRTGVNKFMQGMDPKAIANRTAGGVNQQMNASQGPRELVARCFAETGVKDLFQGFADMNVDFFDMETSIKVNNKWATIKPEDIRGRFDISIDVGIGTGSKQEIFNRIMGMLDRYGAIAKALGPMTMQVFTLEHIKNILREGWELSGFKNTDKFVLPESIGDQMPQNINPTMGGMQGANGGEFAQASGQGQPM